MFLCLYVFWRFCIVAKGSNMRSLVSHGNECETSENSSQRRGRLQVSELGLPPPQLPDSLSIFSFGKRWLVVIVMCLFSWCRLCNFLFEEKVRFSAPHQAAARTITVCIIMPRAHFHLARPNITSCTQQQKVALSPHCLAHVVLLASLSRRLHITASDE